MNILSDLNLKAREIRDLRKGLADLVAGEVLRPKLGICNNLLKRKGCDAAYEVVCTAASTWPERQSHAADSAKRAPYPIKRTEATRWKGVELELRLELIAHVDGLLAELEAEWSAS